MEGFFLPFCVQSAEQVESGRFRRGGKGKHRNVLLLAVATDFVRNHILRIDNALFKINFARAERHRDCRHIFSGGGRMCFVDNHGKRLVFQILYRVHDIREFLYRRADNLDIALKRESKVCRRTLVVHYLNKPRLMFDTAHRVLQLPVHHHAVGANNDIIKNDFVLFVVKRRKPVRKPRNGIRLARTRAVLYQIVLRSAICFHVSYRFADNVKLMIARENYLFFYRGFARYFVRFFLALDKDKLRDKV